MTDSPYNYQNSIFHECGIHGTNLRDDVPYTISSLITVPDLLVATGGEQLGAGPVPAGGVDEVWVTVQCQQNFTRAHVPYRYLL